jgi:hypothetical protein
MDKRVGRRVDPSTASGRMFGRIVDVGLLFSPLRWTAPVQFVFQSRIGERRLSIAMSLAAGVLATILIGGMFLRTGELRIDGWQFFDPEGAAASINPRYYRDSGAERDGRTPTIDSDVISGPVIRLYLPYRPRRHNPLVADACPDLAAVVAKGDAPDNAAGAACVGALYKVSLDGVDVASAYQFTRDAASDFVGVLAYLPTSNLQPGPHELTIDAPGNNVTATREIVRIPFYSVAR